MDILELIKTLNKNLDKIVENQDEFNKIIIVVLNEHTRFISALSKEQIELFQTCLEIQNKILHVRKDILNIAEKIYPEKSLDKKSETLVM